MKRRVLATAIISALAVEAATVVSAKEFPPMDVMSPYDTPAAATGRITVPEPASEAGQQHPEFAIERVNPAAVAEGVLGSPPGAGTGHHLEVGDLGGRDKPEKPDDDDRGKPEKPDKPDKPEKPEDPGDDDDDG